ncbi:unnamed protein product, partial [Caretta caretta]
MLRWLVAVLSICEASSQLQHQPIPFALSTKPCKGHEAATAPRREARRGLLTAVGNTAKCTDMELGPPECCGGDRPEGCMCKRRSIL